MQPQKPKTIGILGYLDRNGIERARKLKESGVNVVIGLRDADEEEQWEHAIRDGHRVVTIWQAVEEADIIQVW